MQVASDPVTPLGEYAPVTPQYTNPLAQFIPNVTYVENGDVVYDDSAPEETSAPDEAATPAATAEAVPTPAAAAEAKQLSVMQTALRTVEAKRGSVQDLIRTLEAVDAKQQAKSKPQFVSQWAMLNKQQRNAQKIRAQMAQVAGHRSQMAQVAGQYISPVYRCYLTIYTDKMRFPRTIRTVEKTIEAIKNSVVLNCVGIHYMAITRAS
jgi:hypothetical protein